MCTKNGPNGLDKIFLWVMFDSYNYEVYITLHSKKESGGCATLIKSGGLFTNLYKIDSEHEFNQGNSNARYKSLHVIFPIPYDDRKITFEIKTGSYNKQTIYAIGYRRIGTNS